MHEGIDIAVAVGTPVGASRAGVVIHAGWLGGYGNLVVVDHGSGLSTAYAHNSGFAAASGQRRPGPVIAYSGNTGNSSGPHVHFEVRINGAPSTRWVICRAAPGRATSPLRGFDGGRELGCDDDVQVGQRPPPLRPDRARSRRTARRGR